MALPLTLVIIAAEIDLSVASVLGAVERDDGLRCGTTACRSS